MLSERFPNELDSGVDVAKHEVSGEPKDAIAEACKRAVTARVGVPLALMAAAIDFDDELGRWSEKVDDEASDDR